MALDQPYSKLKRKIISATFLKHGQTVSAGILSVREAHSLLGVPFHLCLTVRPCIEQNSTSL